MKPRDPPHQVIGLIFVALLLTAYGSSIVTPAPDPGRAEDYSKAARQNNLAIFPINVVCLALCRTQSHRPSQRSLLS